MKLPKSHIALLALVGVNIIWGASPPIFKWSLDVIPPFTFVFLRFLLATLILLPFALHKLKIKKVDFPKLLLLAFVGFTLHISTIFVGLTLAPSINASIIASGAPVFILVGSYFFLKEKLRKVTVFGTVLSLLGILVIVLRPVFDTGIEGAVIGNLLLLSATMSFVVYTILLKKFNLPYSPLTIIFWTFALATITFFPLYAWETQLAPLQIPLQGLIGILFGAVFTSSIAYMLFAFALKHVHASEVGIYLYIDPVITVLIAVPLLGETITLTYVMGALLVFAGIFIAEGRLQYHPLHRLVRKLT